MNTAVKAQELNLAEMSDEEISNLDPSRFSANDGGSAKDSVVTDEEDKKTSSESGAEEEENSTGVTDGADPEDKSSDEDDSKTADSTSGEEEDDDSTAGKAVQQPVKTTGADQAPVVDAKAATGADPATDTIDYKAEYLKLMAPFKAAKRDITPEKPEDVRRLMQMGVDYARKMEDMKPFRRILKTLEKADLLDESKINFLIDLSKKDQGAIKKLFKDSEIDPIDLNLEDSNNYKPTDHTVGDTEIALDDVLDEIRSSPTFQRTIDVVTKEWDSASKKLLIDKPEILRHMNAHMETGIYDQIMNKVIMERTLGRITGMSDLEAYKTVGDAMLERGEFQDKPNSQQQSAAGNTNNQGGSQKNLNGSDESVKALKRAASPTKGSAGPGKKVVDFSQMTDEQIEKFDIRSL